MRRSNHFTTGQSQGYYSLSRKRNYRQLILLSALQIATGCAVHSHQGCNGHYHHKPVHPHLDASTTEFTSVGPTKKTMHDVEESLFVTISNTTVPQYAKLKPERKFTQTGTIHLPKSALDTTVLPEAQYDPTAPVILFRDEPFEKASTFAPISFWIGVGSSLSFLVLPVLSPWLFLAAVTTGSLSLMWYKRTRNKSKRILALIGMCLGALSTHLILMALTILLILIFTT